MLPKGRFLEHAVCKETMVLKVSAGTNWIQSLVNQSISIEVTLLSGKIVGTSGLREEGCPLKSRHASWANGAFSLDDSPGWPLHQLCAWPVQSEQWDYLVPTKATSCIPSVLRGRSAPNVP